MTAASMAPHRARRRGELVATAVLLLAGPIGLYAIAAKAIASASWQTATEVVCFQPARYQQMSVGAVGLAVVMTLSAVTFLFVVPGLLGMLAFTRPAATRSTAHAWSLAANSAALILLCSILRHTVGIHRVSLAAGWLGWTIVLFALAWQRERSALVLAVLWKRYGGGLAIGVITVAISAWAFFPEQFLQCFSEDGTEVYELARSLPEHFLPYYELETWQWETGNRMGTVVVNPSLINSYWTCGLQVLLGGKELPTRLSYWVWWLAIFAVSYRLVRPRRASGSWIAALPLGLLVFLVSLLFSFYVGYNQYMADLANPGVPDALFTLALLLGFDCLRQKDGWGFAVSFALASLVLYAGPVVLLATLAAAWIWQPIRRREVWRWGLRAVGLLAAIAVFYLVWGALEGSLPAWVDTLDIEYVSDYLSAVPRWKSGGLFFGYFLLGCGGIPALGLIRAFRRFPSEGHDTCRREGAWRRTVATATLFYLLVVLCSGFKNLHYLGPLLPIPIVFFLAPDGSRSQGTGAKGMPGIIKAMGTPWVLAACSLLLCIVLCWPKQRDTFTLNRQLGAYTTIATDSQLTALQWTRVRLVLIEEGMVSWYFSAYAWAAYAQWDPSPAHPGPLVLTDGDPPRPEYRLVASRPVDGTDRTAKLYAQNEGWERWLVTRHVLHPLDRYPAVMRPLADGPYSPHNNGLEDVQRLRWPW